MLIYLQGRRDEQEKKQGREGRVGLVVGRPGKKTNCFRGSLFSLLRLPKNNNKTLPAFSRPARHLEQPATYAVRLPPAPPPPSQGRSREPSTISGAPFFVRLTSLLLLPFTTA